MAKMLDVYLNKNLVGELKQDDDGEMIFTYAPTWLTKPNASAISCSLPLQTETFTRKECRAFFSGILPEQQQRKLIAKNLGMSANNDFIMLKCIGGECPGAITFIPGGESLSQHQADYHALNDSELAAVIRELPYRPLLAGDRGVRLSLAGVQDKIAAYEKEITFNLMGRLFYIAYKNIQNQFPEFLNSGDNYSDTTAKLGGDGARMVCGLRN